MNPQYQAAYFFESIADTLSADFGILKIDGLMKSLSWFDVEHNVGSRPFTLDSHIAVLSNVLSRGLPTRLPIELEKKIVTAFDNNWEAVVEESATKKLQGTITYDVTDKFDAWSEDIFKALHIIDPRVRLSLQNYGSILGSGFEAAFLFDHISKENNFLAQLLEPQRPLETIVKAPADFRDQKTDFTLEMPYSSSNAGFVIEIDGPHHKTISQMFLDSNRDTAVSGVKWQIDRVTNENKRTKVTEVEKKFLNEEYIAQIANNYQNKGLDEERLAALQLALSPVAIARIQKIMLELVLRGHLRLDARVWQVAIIERDVPCGKLAIDDLQVQLIEIFRLSGKDIQLPKIKLLIVTTPEFKNCFLNNGVETFLENEVPTRYACDILLDISILQRSAIFRQPYKIQHKNFVRIRSAHNWHSKRTFYTTDLINYGEILGNQSKINALKYFLQIIFRKKSFRPGQLEILNRALQTQSVIGLLPTGGGKSLTYQLAVLLQPGVSLVIDPIKSLMKDQVDNLLKNKIDACLFINSSIKTPQERNRLIARMGNGESLFTFVSPERLQGKEFRKTLEEMHQKQVYFNYCVIDEAHCVSEWGHDFRMAYLRLGRNTITYCKTKSTKHVPLFGLTATASFDVLADVQRELSTPDRKLGEEAIIKTENIDRPELNYYVWPVDAALSSGDSDWKAKEKVGRAKQAKIQDTLQDLQEKGFIDVDCQSGGLIFAPHRGGYLGITDRYTRKDGVLVAHRNGVADNLPRIPALKTGIFMGSSDQNDVEQSAEIDRETTDSQDNFINNKLNLLIATKAFGMGIDKPNIRYTIHVNYPNSLESFVQEAGRAGRDKEEAHCIILFNGQEIKRGNTVQDVDKDNLLFFHNNSFKGTEPEKKILDCLLRDITSGTKTTEISDLIAEELEIEAQVSVWQSKNGAWYLTVSRAFKEPYLNIGLSNLRIFIDQSVDRSMAVKIEPIVLQFLNNKPRNTDMVQWLNSTNTAPGLERRLADIGEGNSCEITVGFRNKWTVGGEEIIADKNDTEKAIYRLSILGVVDDYTIDYNAKVYALTLKKKSNSEYTEYLKAYIRQYYSETRTEEEVAKFLSSRSSRQSVVKDGLHFLIDFVYREIEKKRRLGIDVMKEACYKGLEENGGDKFREFLDLYFNSKYARTDYRVNGDNKSLADRTDNGVEENIIWVWEFIEVVNSDKSGSQLNNLKHLRGACTRLLVTNPDNTTLLLLRAFALFVLEIDNPNDKMIDEAKRDFSSGFNQLADRISNDEWKRSLQKYRELLLKFSSNPKLETIIRELVDSLGIGDLGEKYLNLTTTLHTFTQLLPQHGY